MDDGSEQVSIPDLAKIVSETYDADVVWYSGGIEPRGFGTLLETVLGKRKRKNVLLILTTDGGSANEAYKIARFLHKVYDKFILFAPQNCYSAGTIIALGAHEIIMGPFSELGPLDVQLLKQNELGARKSGLLSRSAFQAMSDVSFELFEKFMLNLMTKSGGLVSFRLASDLSATMTSSIMSAVYGKMDPEVVGGDQRDLEVALHYGLRLAEKSGNASPQTVYHLVNSYPAHDFIIDDDEARTLFENVGFPSSELMLLSAVCGDQYPGAEGVSVRSLVEPEPEVEEQVDEAAENNELEPEAGASEPPVGRELDEGGDLDRQDDQGEGDASRPIRGAANGATRRQAPEK